MYEAVEYAWSVPNHAYYTEIRSVITAEVRNAVAQTKGVQAALNDAARAAQELVDHLIGNAVGGSTGFDPIISEACEYIRQHLNRPITLAELARAVHRSPSRLAHRFREATGVPVRRFILWRRLRAAAESAMRGSSLTEAAHAAGFADSAHLSRTFRSMSPSRRSASNRFVS